LNTKVFIAFASLVLFVVVLAILRQGSNSPHKSGDTAATKPTLTETKPKTTASKDPPSSDDIAKSGEAGAGSALPANVADLKGNENKKADPAGSVVEKSLPVKGNTNPQVRSVAEALRDKSHPERLSALIPPKQFDPQAYRADPASYNNTIEPGRIFQSAQPQRNVPQIRMMSEQLQDVKPGDAVTLRVKAAPKYPVSFSSGDLGSFANKLNTITVEADEVGVAEVKFYASPGMKNTARIIAASPMASGQASFLVNVVEQH